MCEFESPPAEEGAGFEDLSGGVLQGLKRKLGEKDYRHLLQSLCPE